MAYITDAAFDAALNYIRDNAENLYICSAEPTTFAQASSSLKLATKALPTISVPADRSGGGRELTIAAISDGTVDATGTGTHIAITDDSASALLATVALSATQVLTAGNTMTLTAFTVGVQDAV